jgi:RNA polymerase sigma factor (sigma-70 family)
MASLAELVARARGGDRTAFDAVVEVCWDEIFAFTAARSVALEEADELTQEAFVAAWFSLREYEEREVFQAWMKGIARNLLRRRRKARATTDLATVADLIAERLDQDDGAGEDSLERLARVRVCLQRLPEHLRLLATKRFAEDLPLATLCQHLRRTRASIANALTRIRVTLRDCVEQPGSRS